MTGSHITHSGFIFCTLWYSIVPGFNMYEELDHSITTQTLLTDGQTFRIAAYQLNTMKLWKSDEANSTCNLMWISKPYQLYKGIEDGKVVGFDDEALKMLLTSVLMPSREASNIHVYAYPPMIGRKEKAIVIEKEIEFDKQI